MKKTESVKCSHRFHIFIFAIILMLLLIGCEQNNADTPSGGDTLSKDKITEAPRHEETDGSDTNGGEEQTGDNTDDDDPVWTVENIFPDGFDDGEEYFVVAEGANSEPRGDQFYVAIQSKLTASLSKETFPVCVSYCCLGTTELDELDEQYPDCRVVLELRVNGQVVPLKKLELSQFREEEYQMRYAANYDEYDNLTTVYTYPEGEIFNISTDLIQEGNSVFDDNFGIWITLYDGDEELFREGMNVYYHREEDEIKFFSFRSYLDDYLVSIGESEAE